MFYSAATFGDHVPSDCVDVSEAEHQALQAGVSAWTNIVPGANGRPVLQEAPRQEVEDGQWEAIKAERDRRTQHGGFRVGAHWFHSDTFSRVQQLALVRLGASMPGNVQWKTMSGVFVPMTPSLAEQVFAAAAASDIATFAAAEAHRAAMLASVNPASYDFSGGWPPVFGEG